MLGFGNIFGFGRIGGFLTLSLFTVSYIDSGLDIVTIGFSDCAKFGVLLLSSGILIS